MWQILESSIMRILRNSICFFIIFSINTFSQENDFQVWESIRISKKIYKRTNVYLSHGLRFRENSTILDKNYLDIKIAHRIRKTDRRIIMGYRISNILEGSYSYNRNRFYFDYIPNYTFKRYKFSLRNRVEYEGNNNSYNWFFRERCNISYNIRKNPLEPFIQVEYFLDIKKNIIDKLRYSFGISYPIFNNVDASLYYRLQQEINVKNPNDLYILGIKLKYKI